MFSRLLRAPKDQSFFLLGPRGTGKSSWVRTTFSGVPYFDLLDSETHFQLLSSPKRLDALIPAKHRGWVVIDEVQKAPALLDEVHRLIEQRKLKFVLTGSSARKLKAKGVNLLAGRALTRTMHPLTAVELGDDFNLERSLTYGQLPMVQEKFRAERAKDYLASYVRTYLQEEVLQEGLTRNLAAFSRFLEGVSFSQANILNVASVARESHLERKLVEGYVEILEDLLLAQRLPVFSKRAQRGLSAHPKFFLFDAGVFTSIRPRGPLDSKEELQGAALETLVFQELRAHNEYRNLGYALHHWRTRNGLEVDFVLYGERGLKAFEVKRAARLRTEDFKGLKAFKEDYPAAELFMLHPGREQRAEGDIHVHPLESFLPELERHL